MRTPSMMIVVAILAMVMLPAPAVAEGKMRVLGRASIEVAPDHVSVRLGITSKAPSPTAALDQNSAVAKKIKIGRAHV